MNGVTIDVMNHEKYSKLIDYINKAPKVYRGNNKREKLLYEVEASIDTIDKDIFYRNVVVKVDFVEGDSQEIEDSVRDFGCFISDLVVGKKENND